MSRAMARADSAVCAGALAVLEVARGSVGLLAHVRTSWGRCVVKSSGQCILPVEIGGLAMKRQISVPLDAEQRAYVERVAEEQDRSIAAVLRRMVSEAMRAQADSGGPVSSGR
jgi:hypothetical protein